MSREVLKRSLMQTDSKGTSSPWLLPISTGQGQKGSGPTVWEGRGEQELLCRTQVPGEGQNPCLLSLPRERNVTYVQSVGRPLAIAQTSLNTGEHTLGRSLMCAQSVGRLLATAPTWPFITEHTWWTGPMTVSVGKPLGRAQSSLNIKGCTQKRRPTSVKTAGKPSVGRAASFDTIASTRGRSPTSVTSVERVLVSTQVSVPINACTQGRSPISVRSVARPSTIVQTLISITESILARSPIGVTTVGKPSVASPTFPNIRESTLEREKYCNCPSSSVVVLVVNIRMWMLESSSVIQWCLVVDFALVIKGCHGGRTPQWQGRRRSTEQQWAPQWSPRPAGSLFTLQALVNYADIAFRIVKLMCVQCS